MKVTRRRKYIRLLVLLLAAALLGMAVYFLLHGFWTSPREKNQTMYPEAVGEGKEKVLLINSDEPTYPTTPAQVDGITAALYRRGIVLDVEFMGAHEDASSAAVEQFTQRLAQRLRRTSYDGIILSGNAALDLGMRHRDDLLRGLPIVFLDVDSRKVALAACRQEQVTGFLNNPTIDETVDAARGMLPGLSRVVGIVDIHQEGQEDAYSFEEAAERHPNLEFTVINASELTRAELGERLERLTEGTIVLFLDCFNDIHGSTYTVAQSAAFIAAHSAVPVFRSKAGGLGSGILGGCMVDFERVGRQAGQLMARAIREGKDLGKVPLDQEGVSISFYDVSAMREQGIAVSAAPKDAVLLNYTASFWESNRDLLIALLLLTLGMGLVLLLLLYGYLESRRASEKLALSQASLQQVNRALEQLSTHDELTGLGNRYGIDHSVELYLGHPLVVLFMDLDRFKEVNDTWGHAAGDAVLRRFSQVLCAQFSPRDCYRYGGDEFLVLEPLAEERECVQRVELMRHLLQNADIDGRRLDIGFSCGYVVGEAGTDEELWDMVRIADIHIYEAKESSADKCIGSGFDRSLLTRENLERVRRREEPRAARREEDG